MASGTTILPLPPASLTGVTSLNGLSSAVTLVASTGITITPSGQNITIAGIADATKANTALSNLASTAVNTDISPAADGVQALGSTSKHWLSVHTDAIDSVGNLVLSANYIRLQDNGNSSITLDGMGNAGMSGNGGYVICLADGSASINSTSGAGVNLDADGNITALPKNGWGVIINGVGSGSLINASATNITVSAGVGATAKLQNHAGTGFVQVDNAGNISATTANGCSLVMGPTSGEVRLTGPLGGFLVIDSSGEVFLEAPSGSGAGFSTADGSTVSASGVNCAVSCGATGSSYFQNNSASVNIQAADDGTLTISSVTTAINGPTGSPTTPGAPAGYLAVVVNGTPAFIPYFT